MSATATPRTQNRAVISNLLEYFREQDLKHLKALSALLIVVSFTLGLNATSVSASNIGVLNACYLAHLISLLWVFLFFVYSAENLWTLFALAFPDSERAQHRARIGIVGLLCCGFFMVHPLASTIYWMTILVLCIFLWETSLMLRFILALSCVAASALTFWKEAPEDWGERLSGAYNRADYSQIFEGLRSAPFNHGLSVVLFIVIAALFLGFYVRAGEIVKNLTRSNFLKENESPHVALLFVAAFLSCGWGASISYFSERSDLFVVSSLFLCLFFLPVTFLDGWRLIHFIWTISGGAKEEIRGVEFEHLVSSDVFSESNLDGGLQPEDAIRESDGFVKYVVPYVRNRHGMDTDSGEWFAWLNGWQGHLGFRTVSTSPFSLGEGKDVVGRALGACMASHVETLRSPDLKPIRDAFCGASDVLAIDQPNMFLAKMPWDHPGVVLVPRQWTGRFVYPPGSSLYDKSNVPCSILHAEVAINLSDDLCRAVEALNGSRTRKGDKKQLRLCRKAIRNVWRILPGAYESLHRVMALNMPKLYEARHDQTKELLKKEVEDAWHKALPQPLGDLIQVRFDDLVIEPWLSAREWEAEDSATKAEEEAMRHRTRKREELSSMVFEEMKKDGTIAMAMAVLADLRRTLGEDLDGVLDKIERQIPKANSAMVRGWTGMIETKIRQSGQSFSETMIIEINKIETYLRGISPNGTVTQPTELRNTPKP